MINLFSKGRKVNILIIIFWMLIMVFSTALSIIFIPLFQEYLSGTFMIISGIVLILLGGSLVFYTLQQKVEGKLKFFLILTGVSAAGFFFFAFLHNLFYGLGMITGEIVVLNYLLKILEVVFFLIAVIACPIGFLVGIIGSIANKVSRIK
ncbi:MAG: hypothetical protein U9N03_04300 [Candidatus Caldatribacteriota bacterium]|nr:hypothetical protein [Candidatus Caldatribacteriota bacterium]